MMIERPFHDQHEVEAPTGTLSFCHETKRIWPIAGDIYSLLPEGRRRDYIFLHHQTIRAMRAAHLACERDGYDFKHAPPRVER